MNKTISIFGWDVEEQVMTTLIFRMKTSCTPSDLHKRMCIGFGDSMLEITERSILRMRENSIFFRICWEELQGCYDSVKPYANYTPEPMKGKCENDPITLASSSDEYEPVRVKEECDPELAGLDHEAEPDSESAQLGNETIISKIDLLLMIVLQKEEMQPVAQGLITSQRRGPIHQKVTFLDLPREGVFETVDVVFILH